MDEAAIRSKGRGTRTFHADPVTYILRLHPPRRALDTPKDPVA